MDSIFQEIDTKEKAYWLGVLAADGCVKNGRVVQLILGEKDEHLVYSFVRFLKEDDRRIKKYGPYKTSGVQVHFYLNSKKMVEDLSKYEIVERKSKVMRLPFLPDDMYLPYLMGCFDGDGCQNTTCLCSGSKMFLEDIKKKFIVESNIRKSGTVYYLTLGSELFRKMQNSYINSLQRKRKIKINKKQNNPTVKDKCPLCDGEKWSTSKRCKKCWDKICDEKNRCSLCGERKNRHSKTCWYCYLRKEHNREHLRKFNPTKEELDKLINEDKVSLVKIGEMFGVSDNAVKKRAKKFEIYNGRQKNYKT